MTEERQNLGKMQKIRVLTNALTDPKLLKAFSEVEPILFAIFEKAVEQEVENLFANGSDQKISGEVDACYNKIKQISNSPVLAVLERLIANLGQPAPVQQPVQYTDSVGNYGHPRGANGISGF